MKRPGVHPELAGRRKGKEIGGNECETETDTQAHEPNEVRRYRQLTETVEKPRVLKWGGSMGIQHGLFESMRVSRVFSCFGWLYVVETK